MRPVLKKPGCVFLHGELYQNRVWNACNKTFVLHKVCGSEQHSGHWPPAVLVAGGAAHTWDRNLTSVTVPCLDSETVSKLWGLKPDSMSLCKPPYKPGFRNTVPSVVFSFHKTSFQLEKLGPAVSKHPQRLGWFTGGLSVWSAQN